MKIRRLTNEERPILSWPIQGYAFERSPMSTAELDRYHEHLPYHEGNVTLVAEDDGGTRAVVTALPMRQNVRGSVFAMLGLTGVATHPLARRQGYVRALVNRMLGEMRDEGYAITALYPFRPSFYARYGYVGLPRPRTVSFSPADLGELLRADLPGELRWQRIQDGYDGYRAFTERLLTSRHGFSLLPDYRAVQLSDRNDRWLVSAVVDGETIGALTYTIDGHGGTLLGEDLLTVNPLGRALLLQFLARHVDQVDRVSVVVAADESPELWATDLACHTETRVAFPTLGAPMARVLSLEALRGLPVGSGRVHVEIVDDPYLAGGYLLDGGAGAGRLDVTPGSGGAGGSVPTATLTAAGISALVYGVLDPDELPLRGFGDVSAPAAAQLRTLFPRAVPYIFADF